MGTHRTNVLILGGGLAGLTVGMLLRRNGEQDLAILEKDETVGGLLKTSFERSLEIDHLPHIFFTRDEQARQWYNALVPDSSHHSSRLGVFHAGRYLDYPFQLHLHQLPHPERVACLADYLAARRAGAEASPAVDFETFAVRTFGRRVTELFFRPYNEKLWCVPLDRLSTEWVARKIDDVSDRDMARSFLGAAEREKRDFGPHAAFSYPREGGIQKLAEATAANLDPAHIRLEQRVIDVNPQERQVRTETDTWHYERLVWTLPLNRLSALLGDDFAACERLVYTQVTSIHVVCREVSLPDKHWIYFGDTGIPFYRITRVDRFNARYADGPCPMIVEVSAHGQDSVDPAAQTDTVLESLLRLGIISSRDSIEFTRTFHYSPAYVVYDLEHRATVDSLHAKLAEHDIVTAGRFGDWEFYNMDRTMRSAHRAARLLQGALAK